ncbi:MAG TPA: ribosome biogenesis GTP-binding protein YihA/YsxC [Terriglobales bacterium]|nr:ribosome biogenesis GTP-binding protein YihA/YsxC [Terriglobales bacterium]
MRLQVQFVGSAYDVRHFPPSVAPEIAFLGRSNVGKSSLLNSLTGTKLAHVSSTPGRTQAINFFSMSYDGKPYHADLMLVDLPGYGYAKLSKSITAEWPKFIDPYLKKRQGLALCIVLVDSNVPAQASDEQLLDFLRAAGREFVVVATKSDRISRNELNHSLRVLARELGIEQILPYSAKTHAGRNELWKAIRAASHAHA